jgi:hypothetical protein
MRQIRSFVVFVLLGSVIFALASCLNPFEPPSGIEPERVFWAINIEANPNDFYYQCPASLLFTGNFCLVYGEDALNIPESFAWAVAKEFDDRIYSKITTAFGDPSDLDDNGRVIILLLNIREGDTTNGYTAGYFYANDFLYNNRSNRGEILYINYYGYPNVSGSPYRNNLYTAMAHELQHLINRSKHLTNPMDLWIDEGLSSAAEYLYGLDHDEDNPNGRVGWFNKDKQETIRQGNNFFIWDGYWEGYLAAKPYKTDQLANYATVYLFFQWLRIHADNGSAIYREIINSQYTDYKAVTSAAQKKISAFSGITDDDESGWAKILGAWYAANLLRARSGIYGYKNEITLNFTWSYPAGGHQVSLYPGEVVYSSISDSSNKSPVTGTSAIRYMGLNASSNDVDNDIPFSSSTYLLTYNGSTVTEGANPTGGYVADSVPEPAALRRTVSAASDGISEPPEVILKRWDGGRVFFEKLQESGTFPQN